MTARNAAREPVQGKGDRGQGGHAQEARRKAWKDGDVVEGLRHGAVLMVWHRSRPVWGVDSAARLGAT
ncbi:hypothetical protein LZA78_12635 [Sinirhodobacter sp. WL0062]|uniref:Uncharacterized protein n=1 Tax=Rhodobacter flavimaris TaxID=2907145 RepID=A0ABS8YXX6_9RHOB|nr:hypothetical protein [Sinirhodobacter sp. WL0062]MCE5974333.1 hypothetical protein [Sinirhodobacter sp. WL0062]